MSRAFRLGIFIVGSLAILALGVFLIGNKRFLFGSTYHLTAEFDDASGLVNGSEVRVGGIHEGTVSQIDLPQQPGGKVIVVMRMEKSTNNLVRQDSTASIKTDGLLGDKHVEVSYGSPSGSPIANGDTIQGVNPPSLEAEANKATEEANKTMGQIGSAVSTFQEDAEALKHNFFLRGFFKKRGYYDESQLTSNNVPHLPAGTLEKEFAFDVNQMFDKPDSAKLKDRKALTPAGKFLQQNPFSVAVVSTVADKNQTAQQRLECEARAKVVRDYLAQQFKLDDGRLKTYSGAARSAGNPGQENPGGKLQILVYAGESAARPAGGASGG